MNIKKFAIATLLPLGLGLTSVPALAQSASDTGVTDVTTGVPDDDDGDEGKWGLLGLVGLAGLLGLKRRDNHIHTDHTTGAGTRP